MRLSVYIEYALRRLSIRAGNAQSWYRCCQGTGEVLGVSVCLCTHSHTRAHAFKCVSKVRFFISGYWLSHVLLFFCRFFFINLITIVIRVCIMHPHEHWLDVLPVLFPALPSAPSGGRLWHYAANFLFRFGLVGCVRQRLCCEGRELALRPSRGW